MHRYTMRKYYKHVKKTNKIQYINIKSHSIQEIFKKYKEITTCDANIFDELYRKFVHKHKKYLLSNYANSRNVH